MKPKRGLHAHAVEAAVKRREFRRRFTEIRDWRGAHILTMSPTGNDEVRKIRGPEVCSLLSID